MYKSSYNEDITRTMQDRTKQKGYIKNSETGEGVMYDEKKEGKTLMGGRKNKYYKDGKKVAVAKSNKDKVKIKILQERSGIYMDRMDGKLPKDRDGMHYGSTDKK